MDLVDLSPNSGRCPDSSHESILRGADDENVFYAAAAKQYSADLCRFRAQALIGSVSDPIVSPAEGFEVR